MLGDDDAYGWRLGGGLLDEPRHHLVFGRVDKVVRAAPWPGEQQRADGVGGEHSVTSRPHRGTLPFPEPEGIVTDVGKNDVKASDLLFDPRLHAERTNA